MDTELFVRTFHSYFRNPHAATQEELSLRTGIFTFAIANMVENKIQFLES